MQPHPRRRRPLTGTFWFAAWVCLVLAPSLGTAEAAPAAAPAGPSKTDKPAAGDDNTPPPGIDIGKLDDFERKVFFRVVNRESSACGKGQSLLSSAKQDSACRASFYAVRYVAHLVDSGYTDSEIGEKLDKRFRSPRQSRIDIAAAPSKGSASARVTVVEFVDYECPHCKHAQALLRQLVEEYPSDVKVYFKHFPLSHHTNARLAAEAAASAQKQGKFWPYNEKMWANSDSLTPAVLEKSAKDVGLDLARWRADAASDGVKSRIEGDRSEGLRLGIDSTPTVFINGRKYNDALDIASLKDWIDEELGR
jgi:predicted DsbA family dithiol-disulfide isomerase